MPRVSQAHLAARRCFVRNGFHATSMQDVLDEAELSAGAVYRYFRGKDEIIAAIAAEAVSEVAGALDSAFDPDDPHPLDEVLGAAFLPSGGSTPTRASPSSPSRSGARLSAHRP